MEDSISVDMLVTLLAEVFGQVQVSELQMNVWNHALRDLNGEQLRLAYDHLVRTRTDRRFPVPADLIASLHGTYEDAAILGWNTTFKAILSHPGRYLEFEDPIIAETIRELGGIPFLSNLSQRDLTFQRKPFISTYKILCKNGGKKYSPICPGQYKTHNNKPILISKKQDALQLEVLEAIKGR